MLLSFLHSFGDLNILAWLFLWQTMAAVGLQLFGFFAMFVFYFRKVRKLDTSKPLPGVSVIKPCFDNQDNEEENFDLFFNQDYPGPIQLLFVVGHESAPIVSTIKRYLARYPKVDAQLVISTTRKAYWNKVNSLYDAQERAKHEIVIWSDSDVVVKSNYLTQMVASLQEPGVSVVSTPQYDFRINNFATALKVPANNCDDATFMMSYNLLTPRKRAALGHSLGFKKYEFDEFKEEGWALLNQFLGDDIALPYLFNKHGKRVVFRNIYCPVQYSNKTLSQVIEQKRRWVMCQKQVIINRVVYLSACLFYPEVPAAVLMLLSHFQPASIGLFFFTIFLRVGISAVFEALFLKSLWMSIRYFWTIPLWDLMQVYFVIDGFFRNTIELQGRKFTLENRFYLKPVESPGEDYGTKEVLSP